MPLKLAHRRSNERGLADHGWLRSRHTFSFADYFDSKWQGFRNLLVINDDRVAGGKGFPTHGHRDMEIVSYVLEGALQHEDSMGTGSVIVPGDVQRMSAGTGVRHSEYNAKKDEEVHFLQIWINPKARGIDPGYEQKTFSADAKKGKLLVVASEDARDGSVKLHADAAIHAGIFAKGDRADLVVRSGRHAWIHVAKGNVVVDGTKLEAGDAAYTTEAAAGDATITIEGVDEGEVLVFDLP